MPLFVRVVYATAPPVAKIVKAFLATVPQLQVPTLATASMMQVSATNFICVCKIRVNFSEVNSLFLQYNLTSVLKVVSK